MPYYDYVCQDCLHKAEKKAGKELSGDERACVMFETQHAMEPTPKDLRSATICPRCHGTNTVKDIGGKQPLVYVRGAGYLDRAGCLRDMNVHKLETDDPYAGMREAGEVDDMKTKFKKSGQHKPNPKHFTT